jgi:hypothetical protein
MTTPDHSVQPTLESSPPPPETPTIPLPAGSPAAPPVSTRQGTRRVFDGLVVSVVLIFAFLAASFAVRNSDFWMHLAAGRLLAEGRYQFGVDPFCYTTENVYWANHAWLFDLMLYGSYQLDSLLHAEGGLLVSFKALGVTVLAAVLLSMRRRGSGFALPAACTLLAVLAISPRLLLHSTCLSYVFLGLTVWLLWRPTAGPESFGAQLRRYAALLLLFVLWVNVDDWFFLGPVTAALFALGDRLWSGKAAGEARPVTPVWLFPAGLVLCLINPHFLHAFTLPADLTPLPAELRDDPRFTSPFTTAWQLQLLYHPVRGVNLAMGAYFLLLAVGLLSFFLSARNLVGWRLLVWVAFAALSAWLARAIPFFAVVAAPITALNLQDTFSTNTEPGTRQRLVVGASYFALILSGLALIFLAWPGWLQGFRDVGRHVDFAMRPNASLQRVAQRLQQWRTARKLGDEDRGFPVHPSVVHYCAWFCPAEKGFLDARVSLFGDVASEFEEVCRAINPSFGPPIGDWRATLRNRGVTHLILYESEWPRLLPALQHVTAEDKDWRLLDIDGQALVIGWKDRGRALPRGVPAFDADRLAFAPPAPMEEPPLPAAPPQGPDRGPRAASLWSQLGWAVPAGGWQADAANVLLHYSEDLGTLGIQERIERWYGWAASVPFQPALTAGSLDSALRLAVQFGPTPLVPGEVDQQPPALLLLAIRAARSALAENPDDASAWWSLGRAYLALSGLPPERSVLPSFVPLLQLRRIQIAVALENALRCNPDFLPAHESLASLYEGQRYLDVALDHRREALRLARRNGPVPGESAESYANRLGQMEAHTRELQRYVSDLRNEFALRAPKAGSEPYRKAQLAQRMGLARMALEDILMQSTMVLLGGEGIRLEMELMLEMGRTDLVREQLGSADWQANKENLGFVDMPAPAGAGAPPLYRLPAYDWLRFCQAASVGDYYQADEALRELIQAMGGDDPRDKLADLRRALARLLPLEIALSINHLNWWTLDMVSNTRMELSNQLKIGSYLLTEQADLQALGGMLFLERGAPQAAEQSFEQTKTRGRLGQNETHPSAALPLASAYLQLIQQARRPR